ncbi:MAG: hypothetical protein J4F28_09660, partial [Nitrosopumilaceae archaeon]|nr:hypothetical protein [Nitrosopumilaceae archaeon]
MNAEYDMYKQLTVQRRMHEWVRGVPVMVQRAGIRDAFTAAKLSAKHGCGDGPAYRSKKRRGRGALKCALAPVVVDSRTIKLPRFGTVTC